MRVLAPVWACLACGCLGTPGGGLPSPVAPLTGRVEPFLTRAALATPAEIGTAATVSLIDPATNRTIATTLTRPDRTFSLDIPRFAPQVKTYILCSLKSQPLV